MKSVVEHRFFHEFAFETEYLDHLSNFESGKTHCVFRKILPCMYLWARKSPSTFGSYAYVRW